MSILATLQQKAATIQTSDKDVVSDSKFTLNTGLYPALIKVAYLDQYESGAIFIALEFSVDVQGTQKSYKEQICITNKAQSLTYTGQDGQPAPMPGYAIADTLCKLASNTELFKLATEEKAVKVWNKTQRAEVPTNKEVITGLIGTKVILGIYEEKHDHYSKPGETILRNRINKVFATNGQTLSETITGSSPEFITTWIDKNKDKVFDRTVNASTGSVIATSAGTVTTPTSQFAKAETAGAPKSLFG